MSSTLNQNSAEKSSLKGLSATNITLLRQGELLPDKRECSGVGVPDRAGCVTSQLEGFLLLNKPSGPTSHDIVDKLRKITGIKKIGHAGTLDPFASGLLILAISRSATKQINKFVKLDKEYVARLHLGAETDSYDRTGEIKEYQHNEENMANLSKKKISSKEVRIVLESFLGPQKQIPPMFSAKKVKGQKLYKLARKGIEVKREASDINVYKIKLLELSWPFLEIKVSVSSGTYVRSLALDIGRKLKTGAYLEELQRTKIGEYDIKNALELENLDLGKIEKNIQNIDYNL